MVVPTMLTEVFRNDTQVVPYTADEPKKVIDFQY